MDTVVLTEVRVEQQFGTQSDTPSPVVDELNLEQGMAAPGG